MKLSKEMIEAMGGTNSIAIWNILCSKLHYKKIKFFWNLKNLDILCKLTTFQESYHCSNLRRFTLITTFWIHQSYFLLFMYRFTKMSVIKYSHWLIIIILWCPLIILINISWLSIFLCKLLASIS
jgi:hypothetical protein